MPALCRDCLTLTDAPVPRCPACRSPRIVAHDELTRLSIAHMDCDAFYASVEKRDNPALRDQPVIVGGGQRGVVSTCCYIARIKGVRSAMPMFQALKLCPEAVVVKPRFSAYTEASRAIRAMMEELTPAIEPLSLDEAFLDLTGTARLHGAAPAVLLARLTKRMEDELGLTGSIGLSHNKFLAKIASDLDKPRGFSVIGRAEAVAMLAVMPVSAIWGVGAATAARLRAAGIDTIGQLQHMAEADLIARFGKFGRHLYLMARGEDVRRVTPDRPAKSVSNETTFVRDIRHRDDLLAALAPLADKVAARLAKADLAGHTVVLKLKTADFRSLTRNHRLAEPTRRAELIRQIAAALLEREADGRPFRLIGIGVTDLCLGGNADPPDLFGI